jgi:hypothetical protein
LKDNSQNTRILIIEESDKRCWLTIVVKLKMDRTLQKIFQDFKKNHDDEGPTAGNIVADPAGMVFTMNLAPFSAKSPPTKEPLAM